MSPLARLLSYSQRRMLSRCSRSKSARLPRPASQKSRLRREAVAMGRPPRQCSVVVPRMYPRTLVISQHCSCRPLKAFPMLLTLVTSRHCACHHQRADVTLHIQVPHSLHKILWPMEVDQALTRKDPSLGRLHQQVFVLQQPDRVTLSMHRIPLLRAQSIWQHCSWHHRHPRQTAVRVD